MTTTREAAIKLREAVQLMRSSPIGVLAEVHEACIAFDAALSTPATEPQGYVEGMREAARIVDERYAAGEMGNPGHHIIQALAAHPASPDTRVVDWQQLEAVAHALSVADAKCDPEVIHKLEAQARAIIGGQDRG